MQVVPPPPQVHYVASCPMPSIANEKDHLIVCSYYLDLVQELDMVTPFLGTSQFVLPPIAQSESIDMYSFQSVILLSNKELLEAMVNFNEHSSLSVSRSLKNETNSYEHSSLSLSCSLKNEIDPPPIESSLLIDPVLEPSFHFPVSVDHISSSISIQPIPSII
jgi:hypothetical protein